MANLPYIEILSSFMDDIGAPALQLYNVTPLVIDRIVGWGENSYLSLTFTIFRTASIVFGLLCNIVVLIIITHCKERGRVRAYYFLKLLCLENLASLAISLIIPFCLKYTDHSTVWCNLNVIFIKVYVVIMPSLTYLRNGIKVSIAWDRYVCLKHPSKIDRVRRLKLYHIGPYLYAVLCIAIHIPNHSMYTANFVYLNPSRSTSVPNEEYHDPRTNIKCWPGLMSLTRTQGLYIVSRDLLVYTMVIVAFVTVMTRMVAYLKRLRTIRSQIGFESGSLGIRSPISKVRFKASNLSPSFHKVSGWLGTGKIRIGSVTKTSVQLILQPVSVVVAPIVISNSIVNQDKKWSRISNKFRKLFIVIICNLFVRFLRTLYNTTYFLRCTLTEVCTYFITPFERIISILQIYNTVFIIGFIVIDDNLMASYRSLRKRFHL